MTTTIPAGWKLTRGTDDEGPHVDVTPPDGEAHGWRYHSADGTVAQDLAYRFFGELLDAPAAPQAEPVNAEDVIALCVTADPQRTADLLREYFAARSFFASAEAQKPQRLTNADIDAACADIYGSDHGGTLTLSLQRAIARAIERRITGDANG